MGKRHTDNKTIKILSTKETGWDVQFCADRRNAVFKKKTIQDSEEGNDDGHITGTR